MSRRRVARAAVAVAAVVALSGCGGPEVPDVDVRTAATGATAPTTELEPGGWPEVAAFVAAASAAGDATVVNLFASWCAPCERELPLLLATSTVTPGVRWVGVATEDLPEDAAAFVARMGVDWPSVLDREASVHVALEGIAMPTTAFFDADGELVSVVTGELDVEQLTDELARIAPDA